jgi:hypothetical protein
MVLAPYGSSSRTSALLILTEFRANYPDVLVTDYAKVSTVGQAFLVHTL